MEGRREHLLIVDPDADDPLEGWPGQVGHQVSDRLSLIRADDATLDTLRRRPGVVGVFSEPVPQHLVQALDDDERLFVEAWSLRHRSKRRRGDGEDWGSEGFVPPDP